MIYFYRYCNICNSGGVVIATSLEQAIEKLKKKFGNDCLDEESLVWLWQKDDYFDSNNPDVIDCYNC